MSRIVKDTCPICGAMMVPGRRMVATFKWEGADIEKRVFDYETRRISKVSAVGTKCATMTVCPECGMRAAGELGIEKPECVPW